MTILEQIRAAEDWANNQQVVLPSEREADGLFRKHGGSFHGPRVETATIPKADFYRFCEELILRTANIVAVGALPTTVARTHMGALLAVCDAAKEMRESQAAWQEVAAFAHMDSQTMKDAERRKFEAVIALDAALAALTQETPDAA